MSRFPVGLGLLLLFASLALFAPQSFPGVSVRCTSDCDIVIIVSDSNHHAVLSFLGFGLPHQAGGSQPLDDAPKGVSAQLQATGATGGQEFLDFLQINIDLGIEVSDVIEDIVRVLVSEKRPKVVQDVV
jgi:hypothetical protein